MTHWCISSATREEATTPIPGHLLGLLASTKSSAKQQDPLKYSWLRKRRRQSQTTKNKLQECWKSSNVLSRECILSGVPALGTRPCHWRALYQSTSIWPSLAQRMLGRTDGWFNEPEWLMSSLPEREARTEPHWRSLCGHPNDVGCFRKVSRASMGN